MEYVLFKQISNINMDQSPTSSTFNEVKRDYQHLMRNRMEKYRETLGLLQYRLGKNGVSRISIKSGTEFVDCNNP